MMLTNFKIWAICVLLSLNTLSFGQSYFGIQVNAVYAFEDEPLKLFSFEDEINLNYSYGAQAFVFYSRKFKKIGLEPKFGIGGKHLVFEATRGSEEIEGTTYKVSLLLGTDYHFNSKWHLGVDLVLENNLDFDIYRISTDDLYRYNVQIRAGYKLFKRFYIQAYYSRILYPDVDFYLISNPSNQFGLGCTYKLFKV